MTRRMPLPLALLTLAHWVAAAAWVVFPFAAAVSVGVYAEIVGWEIGGRGPAPGELFATFLSLVVLSACLAAANVSAAIGLVRGRRRALSVAIALFPWSWPFLLPVLALVAHGLHGPSRAYVVEPGQPPGDPWRSTFSGALPESGANVVGEGFDV